MVKTLILVPHPDDELNLIGNIFDYIVKTSEVFICFSSTETDKKKSLIRKKEAIKSCKVFGLSEKNIIFLDFPDVSPTAQSHFFLFENEHNNFVNALVRTILSIEPDIIFGTDLDCHPDHRALSIATEEAICLILKERTDYVPILFKGFCYEFAYYGIEDYRPYNLEKCKQKSERISNPSYIWNNRISILSIETHKLLLGRKLFKALKKHKSQYAVLKAASVINLDNVFWQRRTDNLCLNAKFNVSSGNHKYLNDFKIVDTNELFKLSPSLDKSLWIPDKNDKFPKIEINLSKLANIKKIVLHGDPNWDKKKFVEIQIIIGNKEWALNYLREYGMDTIVETGLVEKVTKIEIIFKSLLNVCLSEIEVFSDVTQNYIFDTNITNKIENSNKFFSLIDKIVLFITKFRIKLFRKISKMFSFKG